MEDLKSLTQAVADLDEGTIVKLVDDHVSGNPSPSEAQMVLNACQEGMSIVGERFDKDEYYIADLVFAGELMTGVADKLKPYLGEEGAPKAGKIVLGTVKGDVHDIGKNIFKTTAEAGGFAVYDLGVDQPADAFVKKVEEVDADIVGMSGLLGYSTAAMADVVAALREAGLRERVKIIIGGQAVSQIRCEQMGADAFTTNAHEGLQTCLGWVRND
ncbi:MAG: cobalamin B12-binding domain-containing protein [bacterium]